MSSILRALLQLLAVSLHHWAEVSKVQPSGVQADAKWELESCNRGSLGSRNSEQGCWNWGKRLPVVSPTSCLWLTASPSLLLNIYRHTWPLIWKKKIHFVPDFPEGSWPAGRRAGEGSILVSNEGPQAGVLVWKTHKEWWHRWAWSPIKRMLLHPWSTWLLQNSPLITRIGKCYLMELLLLLQPSLSSTNPSIQLGWRTVFTHTNHCTTILEILIQFPAF